MPTSDAQKLDNGFPSAPEEFSILRSAPNKEFSNILYLCAHSCGAQHAALVIVEKEKSWVKTTYGLSKEEVPKEDVFWQAVFEQGGILEVRDIKEDTRFQVLQDSRISTFIGVPLVTENGDTLGIISISNEKPIHLAEPQRECLNILAKQVLNLVAFTKQNNQYLRVQQQLEQKYRDLEKFASVVSHDLKSPLANIISLTDLLKEENQGNFNDDTREYLDYLSQASHSLRSYVDGLLIFYRTEHLLNKKEEDFELGAFFKQITKLYTVNPQVVINYPTRGRLQQVNKSALSQIFMNLISNAIKHNSKEFCHVDILFEPRENYYHFEVKDNGNGIPAEKFQEIFELFTTLDQNDRDGNPGSGIGLATVKKLVEHMGGDIEISSEPGKGSNFKFKIKRSY